LLIINADDWGRSVTETDTALKCWRERRISSVSAMVFMEDSERASRLACEHGVDAGLHLNLSERYQRPPSSARATHAQARIANFQGLGKYSVLLYHPGLRKTFTDVVQDQWDEFLRLYGKPPSHVDGHQHKHLCANLVAQPAIPRGQCVRRNFSFDPREKGRINRFYRKLVDRRLASYYRLTDFFFSLSWSMRRGQLGRVYELSKQGTVELMTHPISRPEYEYLTGPEHAARLGQVELATFSKLTE
jgi:predicted glycoside hydrolase/deacetylase ChbG (UPF0249 family)